MSFGFLPEKTQPEHWAVGQGVATQRFGAGELMPNGHGWGIHLPIKEIQRRGKLETSACTVFGSANCWETLANFHGFDDFPKDLSERYNAILANVTPQGAYTHVSCETFRKFGAIPEHVLPFSEDIRTWDYFYSPKPMDESLVKLGQDLLRKFVLGHEWIWNDNRPADWAEKLKSALGRGTVGISLYAWNKNGKYYVSKKPNNHWVMLVDYKEGEYWEVFDHYEPTLKRLSWDSEFHTAKLFFLKRNESGATPMELDWLTTILERLMNMLKKLGSWIG